MKIYLTVILCLLLLNAKSQTVDDLLFCLNKKDKQAFELFLQMNKINENCARPEIRIRNIFEQYFEITGEVLFYNKNVECGKCNYYKVNILSSGNEVIKYEVFSKIYIEPEFKYKLLQQFSDENKIISFSESYKLKLFRAPTFDELFNNQTVYGRHCGIAGFDPEERKLMENCVISKNRDWLFSQFLTSTNFEKKLYGYEGFKLLMQRNLSLSKKEKIVIDDLRNYKGIVATCNGCLYMKNYDFQELLTRIDTCNNYQITELTHQTFPKKIPTNYDRFVIMCLSFLVLFLLFLINRLRTKKS